MGNLTILAVEAQEKGIRLIVWCNPDEGATISAHQTVEPTHTQTTPEEYPMIALTNTVINPAFIEEAYTRTVTDRAEDGGWRVYVDGNYHWTPTPVCVVVHFGSGRVAIYGGADANTLWMALHGTVAYEELDADYETLSGYGVTVQVKAEGATIRYRWVDNSTQYIPNDITAKSLLLLLVDNGYVSSGWVGEDLEAVYSGGGLCVYNSGESWDTNLLAEYSTM